MAITLTETAANHVQRFLAKDDDLVGLRVGIKTVGCSGYAYELDFAKAVEEGDTVFDSHGVKVIVRDKHLPFLDGTCLDYRKEGLNEGFRFDNPNVKDMCGCGESFSV